jgi:LysM repeat protein
MRRRAVHLVGVTWLWGLALLGVGCHSAPLVENDAPTTQVQALLPMRDRAFELSALRAEMAATRIAAAKKEAELLQLRDLIQQLRLENAESRQAVLELQSQAEQRQRDLAHAREAHTGQAQMQASQDLSVLKETVVTLAQELGQLRQELAKPGSKERMSPVKSIPSKSPATSLQESRSYSSQPVTVTRQPASLPSALSPIALTVTIAEPVPPSTMIVQPGDTVASLAKRYRTTVEILRKLNALNGETLTAGRTLLLPISPQP